MGDVRFNLMDPGAFITETPTKEPFITYYRIGLFCLEQARTFFSLEVLPEKCKVFAVDEDTMELRVVTNLDQAASFFVKDQCKECGEMVRRESQWYYHSIVCNPGG